MKIWSMEFPISELFDRYTITKLKNERLPRSKVLSRQFFLYKRAVQKTLSRLDKEKSSKANQLIKELLSVNKKIWNLEYELRAGLESKMTLDEIGRRALKIRNLNGIRGRIKNKICKLFGQEEFTETKVDYISEGVD